MRGLEELKKYLLASVDDTIKGAGNFRERIAAAKTKRELLRIITDYLPVLYKAGIVSKKFFEREFEAGELAYAGIYIYGWHEVRDRKVFALDKAKVWDRGNSEVEAYDNSMVFARNSSTVRAYGDSEVWAYDNSMVWAYDNSAVWARNGSKVFARDGSKVFARNGSIVFARDGSQVWAYDNSEVEAYDNSEVEIYDKARLCDLRELARRIP